MSSGNGRDWAGESNPTTKSRSFNCRFRIKTEDCESNMENKPQYENMQVSAVFFPFVNESGEKDGSADQQNRLACVARRIPPNEKSPTSLGVEQFTTRMDRGGKVLDIDTSGVSTTYSQYLNKELVGAAMLDFCHPADTSLLKQHLKETLECGANTSVVYKLQVGRDRYVKVQTKSKKFGTQTAGEHVLVSTHSIIRDSEPNGNNECRLNELVMEMFPNWTPVDGGKPAAPEARQSNQKLRNLLTQDDSRLASRQATPDEITLLTESRAYEVMPRRLPARSNVILRDLLNQEDEEPPLELIEPGPSRADERSNNMLRKLLNNDDMDKSYRKSQDLIHQLLIAGSTEKASTFQNDKLKSESLPSPRMIENSVPKPLSLNASRTPADVTYLAETSKRKPTDRSPQNSLPKRQNVGGPHAHLAGQNPMLASMLAQTPRTPPSVPTSVASTIMTQLPQERLPKNLEKKLVHTPTTTVPQDDSRQKSHFSQQGFLDKILSTADESILIARSLALPSSNLVEMLDGTLVEAENNQASDPGFAEILEQIYSLQEDLNVETPQGTDDRGAILKLLGEVMDPRPVQDVSEKIAISAIQKQLMSFEGSTLAVSRPLQNVPTYSQAGRSTTQVVQTQLTPEQIALLQQQQQMPPNYNTALVANRLRIPVTSTYGTTDRRQLVRNTYVGLGNANVNQIRKSLIEKKQKLYLQQQQKRLLEQQQKQQLTMQTQQPLDIINTTGPFPENMTDLLNNTVAPNVTLLRSSSITDGPSSTRFTLSTSPQLSPGQRGNPQSPFSPPFQSPTPPPSTYQQTPHPPPSYPQGRSSLSPVAVSPPTSQWANQRTSPLPNNLQMQNPMLNAQLSQHGSAQQQQQRLTLRSSPVASTSFSAEQPRRMLSAGRYEAPSYTSFVASPKSQVTHFTFDRPFAETSSPQMSSEFVRAAPLTTLNMQSLSREMLQELGLSVEDLMQANNLSDGQPSILYSQALLNATLESSSQPTANSPRVEEAKPADQKKSLLQQLLSEPT